MLMFIMFYLFLNLYLQVGTVYVRESTRTEAAEETNVKRHIPISEGATGTRNSSKSAVRSSQRGFSAELLGQSQPVHCKDLLGHSEVIRAIEFSNDGSLLVSGGDGGRPVLIWRMDQVLSDRTHQPVPSELKVTRNDFKLYSLAVSPDKSRTFLEAETKQFMSTTLRRKFIITRSPLIQLLFINFYFVFICRTGLLNAVYHGTLDVCSIALQPGNSTGAVFAAGCFTDAACYNDECASIQIFDIRRSITGKLQHISYQLIFLFYLLIP